MRLKLELALFGTTEIVGVSLADTLRQFADKIEGMEFSDFEILSGKILTMENGRSVKTTVIE